MPRNSWQNRISATDLLDWAKKFMVDYCQSHDIEIELNRSGIRRGQVPRHRSEMAIKLVNKMGVSFIRRRFRHSSASIGSAIRPSILWSTVSPEPPNGENGWKSRKSSPIRSRTSSNPPAPGSPFPASRSMWKPCLRRRPRSSFLPVSRKPKGGENL